MTAAGVPVRLTAADGVASFCRKTATPLDTGSASVVLMSAGPVSLFANSILWTSLVIQIGSLSCALAPMAMNSANADIDNFFIIVPFRLYKFTAEGKRRY